MASIKVKVRFAIFPCFAFNCYNGNGNTPCKQPIFSAFLCFTPIGIFDHSLNIKKIDDYAWQDSCKHFYS